MSRSITHKEYITRMADKNPNISLSYDFYIPTSNVLIEYQGEQHEKPFNYFGSEKKLTIQKEHDKRKKIYAESNGIYLLEIWYWDFNNIEKILTDKLEDM